MKILFGVVFLLSSLPLLAQDFDVLIRNGRVIDGSGNPWMYADVGIKGDKIALVGRASANASAKRTIDATGLIVAPGFIDMLDQSEGNLLVDRQAVSKLTQGITTGITGEGGSIAPQNDMTIDDQKDWLEHYKLSIDWRDLDGYFKRLEKQGSGINLGTYVGAAQVREIVIGRDNRAATPEQIRQMQELVETAMRQGALGVSSSLIYAPGNYASTEELIALAQAASKHGGIYASHIRNEANAEMEALDEAFRIGREGNMQDPKVRAEIRAELARPMNGGENMWHGAGEANGILVASVLNPSLKQYEGKRISEVAKMQNKDPLDALMDLVVADHDNVGAIYFSMSADDVKLAMQQPWMSIGCDFGAVSPIGPLAEGKAHPRAYGSFPRILGYYVREQKTLALEDAIRKFTSLAAQTVRLQKRGLLKEGFFADMTVFNPETVADVATFEDPNRTSRGIEYVFVNGVLSVEHDKVTGEVGGRPLRRRDIKE